MTPKGIFDETAKIAVFVLAVSDIKNLETYG